MIIGIFLGIFGSEVLNYLCEKFEVEFYFKGKKLRPVFVISAVFILMYFIIPFLP